MLFILIKFINIHMPHTIPPQGGNNNPQGERPVSHFDKRREHGHSGYGKNRVSHAT